MHGRGRRPPLRGLEGVWARVLEVLFEVQREWQRLSYPGRGLVVGLGCLVLLGLGLGIGSLAALGDDAPYVLTGLVTGHSLLPLFPFVVRCAVHSVANVSDTWVLRVPAGSQSGEQLCGPSYADIATNERRTSSGTGLAALARVSVDVEEIETALRIWDLGCYFRADLTRSPVHYGYEVSSKPVRGSEYVSLLCYDESVRSAMGALDEPVYGNLVLMRSRLHVPRQTEPPNRRPSILMLMLGEADEEQLQNRLPTIHEALLRGHSDRYRGFRLRLETPLDEKLGQNGESFLCSEGGPRHEACLWETARRVGYATAYFPLSRNDRFARTHQLTGFGAACERHGVCEAPEAASAVDRYAYWPYLAHHDFGYADEDEAAGCQCVAMRLPHNYALEYGRSMWEENRESSPVLAMLRLYEPLEASKGSSWPLGLLDGDLHSFLQRFALIDVAPSLQSPIILLAPSPGHGQAYLWAFVPSVRLSAHPKLYEALVDASLTSPADVHLFLRSLIIETRSDS